TGDGIPIDDVGQLASAGLEKSNCLAATGCARVSRRNVRRAGTSDTVVPLRNSLARGNTEEQAPNRVDIVILEIEALQPGIVPVQFFRDHKILEEPFFPNPIDSDDDGFRILLLRFRA